MGLIKYLTPKDDGAFVDFPKKEIEHYYGLAGYTKECPRCKGHGGWNLQLNAYPLHSYENTAENRHRYAHYRSMCDICNGWGYIHQNQNSLNSDCVENGHVWSFVQNLGRCYNRYKCLTCGIHQEVDSSD